MFLRGVLVIDATDRLGWLAGRVLADLGYESDFLRPVYPVDRVKPEDFFGKKDIENARSRMVGWVHSLARSGR